MDMEMDDIQLDLVTNISSVFKDLNKKFNETRKLLDLLSGFIVAKFGNDLDFPTEILNILNLNVKDPISKLQIETKAQKYVCDICFKTCKNEQGLQYHKMSHCSVTVEQIQSVTKMEILESDLQVLEADFELEEGGGISEEMLQNSLNQVQEDNQFDPDLPRTDQIQNPFELEFQTEKIPIDKNQTIPANFVPEMIQQEICKKEENQSFQTLKPPKSTQIQPKSQHLKKRNNSKSKKKQFQKINPNNKIEIKMYKCHLPDCGRLYKHKYSRNQHIREVHSGVKFACNYENCTYSSVTKSNISKHWKSMHEKDIIIPKIKRIVRKPTFAGVGISYES